MASNLFFNFSDLILKISFDYKAIFFIPKPYNAFITDTNNYDFSITYLTSIENIIYTDSEKLNWVFNNKDNVYYINIKSQKSNYRAIRLEMPLNSNHWKCIFYNIENKADFIINPFIHPLGSLIQKKMLLKNSSFFIHGSGLCFKNKGLIFTGKSGVGKTTISKIFENISYHVHDDRLIISKANNEYFMFNSPMINVFEKRSCKVDKIFSIKQSNKNELVRISGIKAINEIIPNIAQHNIDNITIDLLYNSAIDFIKNTECYILYFNKNENLIGFIDNNL